MKRPNSPVQLPDYINFGNAGGYLSISEWCHRAHAYQTRIGRLSSSNDNEPKRYNTFCTITHDSVIPVCVPQTMSNANKSTTLVVWVRENHRNDSTFSPVFNAILHPEKQISLSNFKQLKYLGFSPKSSKSQN